MRFTFVILLFCCFGSDAQMIIKAHANYRPYAVAQNLLLDDYPNAAAAYSLRKLDKDYTGSAIRVRRSNDNSEQDIGFTSGGDLDTASLKTFVGAGNNGFVTVWYDQSGNARNATQSTAANQPRIVNAGTVDRRSGDISLVYDGTNDYLEAASTSGLTISPTSFYAVSSRGNNAENLRTILSTGILTDHRGYGVFYIATNNIYNQVRFQLYTYISVGNYANTINTNNLLFSTITNTSNNTWFNGGNNVSETYSYTNNTTSSNIIIGSRLQETINVPGFHLNGTTSEIVIWGANQSSNRTGIENNINDYYNIYWNGDFAGILDTYSGSAAAYSLRNLSSTYTGPLVRVRRSNDNAEQDIFGDYYGNLDTVGLKDFVGANSGFVTTWYDQSGNARNATQTTAANQPRVVNAGTVDRRSGDISLVYDGTNDFLQAASTSGLTISPTSFYAVSSRGNDADNLRVVLSTGILTDHRGYGALYTINFAPTNTINNIVNQVRFQLYTYISVGNYANTINTNNLLFSTITNTSNNTWFNGGNNVSETYSYTNNTTSSNIIIGSRLQETTNVPGFHLNGTTSEIVIWGANQSSNRTGIENNINTYYSIY